MKVTHLIALAVSIALLHLMVIFLVMNGGCSDSTQEKTPVKPQIPAEEKKVSPLPPAPADGRFKKANYTENPIIPGVDKKNTVTSIPSAIPQDIPSAPALPAIPGEQENGKAEVFGKLPPPSTHRNILNRGKYDYKYAVNGKISAIPGLSAATSGILLEVNTRRILWMKNPNKAVPIASMSKIMTMLLACEDVEGGRVTLNAKIPATKTAMALREGVVWMRKGETFTLQSLLEAAAVKSANDASLLIAEYLGNGKSEDFIDRMNSTAVSLGMKNTRFFNPHGLPGKKSSMDNKSSPEDLLKLCEYAMTSPLFRDLAQLRKAEFRRKGEKGHMVMWNHNHLLPGHKYGVAGVRGIKTGYIRRAGFCVAVSCVQSGQEFLAIVTGFPTAAERDRNMRALLQWGFIRAKNPSVPEERVILKSREKKKTFSRRKSSSKSKKSTKNQKNKK